ncbi:aminoglycoside phosphotransferase family protein [Nocardioides KLBMP 9356]|uniref:Aminoglycoside phosphotransferase family protein n=1 Tax=Nocardioides potassii TaxID=2911371 RepID=A0ABS9HEG9_9ACTN|nr:phosphotransferase [Nocardioides potassii]MCF6378909.1 aminoglycoside phosphotransferase family protein [Nocardioides potassii]
MSEPQDRWRDPQFVSGAHAWIHEQLDHTVSPVLEIQQTHVTDWSTVMRVTTRYRTSWFKANDESMRHEAAVTAFLAPRSGERVPRPQAYDPGTGWMLTADMSPRLREVIAEERSLARWHDALRGYAGIQIACEDAVDELLALGLPDRRLATLPGAYADLVAGLPDADRRLPPASDVEELCARLASYGIRETVQHDDLHDGQVFLPTHSHAHILDWGDACVSHPFFTLAVTLEGVIAWGVEDVEDSEDLGPHLTAYLEPYAARYGTTVAHLRGAAEIAMRLGWVCRAVNGHLPQDPDRTRVRLKMFLDGKP